MDKLTIYGSSGKIRYPRDASNSDDSRIDRMRDQFFQQIYLQYQPSDTSLYTFFRASSGVPEQFVAQYQTTDHKRVFTECTNHITDIVEGDLNWQITPSNDDPGQRLFEKLSTASETVPGQYDTDVIHQLIKDGVVDFETPDHESAVGLLKHFVRAYDGKIGVAVCAKGRTDRLADVDIVITPDAPTNKIRGVAETHERYGERYTEMKTNQVMDHLDTARSDARKAGYNDFTDRVVSSFRQPPINIGQFDYVIFTDSTLRSRFAADAKRTVGVVGTITFLVALWYAGTVNIVSEWFGTAGSTEVFFLPVDVSLLDPIEPVTGISLLAMTGICLFGWGVLGGGIVAKSQSLHLLDNLNWSNGPAGIRLREQYEEAVDDVFNDVRQSPFTDVEEFVTELSAQMEETLSVNLRSQGSDLVRRITSVVFVALLSVVVAASIGWGLGAYVIEPLLGAWLYIAGIVLLITGTALAVGVTILMFLLSALTMKVIPTKVIWAILALGMLIISGYVVWWLYGAFGIEVAALASTVGVGVGVFGVYLLLAYKNNNESIGDPNGRVSGTEVSEHENSQNSKSIENSLDNDRNRFDISLKVIFLILSITFMLIISILILNFDLITL